MGLYYRSSCYTKRGTSANEACLGILYADRIVDRSERVPDNPDRIPVVNFRYRVNSFVSRQFLTRLKER